MKTPKSARRGTSTPNPGETSLQPPAVVLPFETLGPDPENSLFADAVTEDVINQLSKISRLSVSSCATAVKMQHSSVTFRGHWYNPRSGAFLGTAIGIRGGGEWSSPPAPDAEDWAVLIEAK